MARVLLLGPDDGVTAAIAARLAADHEVVRDPRETADAVVYRPRLRGRKLSLPDLEEAEANLRTLAASRVAKLVLLSSAAVHSPRHDHPGHVGEAVRSFARNPIAQAWNELEELAERLLEGTALTILRPVAVLARDSPDYLSRLLHGKVAFTLAGHDPSVQLLSPEDLAEAVARALERGDRGVYHVAPDGAAPLRAVLRQAGVRRVPLPLTVQRLARAAAARLGWADPAGQLDAIRYSSTVSNRKIKDELGFEPSSAGASEFDPYGMDKGYIAAYGRTLFRFLHRRWWRIEVRGLEHVPRQGRAMLVGVHRGFQPWDGVMTLHTIATEVGRHPRFLIHPGLIKFPFLANYMTKLGGIVACQENAEWVLGNDELLGFYPEGIRGAFSMYKDAYKLKKFGRDEFVRTALRGRAPIIPFVTVGSAEIYPILGKIEWSWFKRYTEWPFLPIAPPFVIPLPSKWHTRFLEPIPVHLRYPPEAADDQAIVREISLEVRARMEEALQDMLRKRKSIFFGSIFEGEAAVDGAHGKETT
ncbi:MAG TPA: 1-acyl-sn-glycerol-3-phosphate acyltransferase [Thermoanaerobaculia bacterium]|nr:1-acyl-sn-glycerol-3-phosphate acyltransferase [Thermoanaerobaculia bacterium]